MKNKNCQYCGEEVLAVAVICKHCKSELKSESESIVIPEAKAVLESETPPRSFFKKLAVGSVKFAGGAFVFLFVIAMFSESEEPNLGAASSTKTSERQLEKIFNNWDNAAGNRSDRKLKSSELITNGTVLSSEFLLDSDKTHRSTAVLGCFVYSDTWNGSYSANNETCILNVSHPESRYYKQIHRGRSLIGYLHTQLENASFVE